MSIKQNGGVFGRNPTFNDVTIEGDLIINGEVFTGLDFQGSWNASTNSPTLASSVGTNGEFYIVSIAGGTNLNGITNWGIGDWAIFNGTVWQRVEGGADGNFNALTANSLTVSDDSVGAYIDASIVNTNAGGYSNLTLTAGPATSGIYYAPSIFFAIGPAAGDTTTPIVFRNNNATERMRVLSTGSVLFGQSLNDRPAEFTQPLGASIAGATGHLHGQYQSSVSGMNMLLNRKGTDGTILGFRKGGADVGSIGGESGTSFIDGHATASGMRFDTFGVLPRKSGAIANNSVDLGSATTAWQDLYLSSGVYLGGTGAANKLDAYEEGTWTPAFAGPSAVTYTQQSGRYTRVGRAVQVQAVIRWSSFTAGVSNVSLGGLPFSVEGTDNFNNTLDVTYANTTTFTYINEFLSGGTMFFYNGASSHGAASTNPYGSSGTILINGTFYA